MNNDQLIAAFRKFIAVRAAAEGITIDGLSLDWATLDATWGDKCGYVVSGLTAELNERIAKCFQAFCSKHAGPGSYGAQRSIDLIERPFFQSTHPNSLGKWFDAGSFRGTGTDGLKSGRAVSLTYYPCAD